MKLRGTDDGTVPEVQATGKLGHGDCQFFVPEIERLIKRHGKSGELFNMVDFHGWDGAALQDDIGCDVIQ
jgi:hypothetical protein